MTAPGERLLAAWPWGRVASSEGAEPGSAVVVTTIVALPGADLEGALGLVRRWQGHVDPVVPALISGAVSADSLTVRHAALSGSTVSELVGAFGALTEAQCAALFFDLIAGLRRCHAARLVVGRLDASALFVCPPGLDGVAALRCQGAGMPLLVAACRGGVGRSGSEGQRALLGPADAVAPEVSAGRLPAMTSDVWSLAATMIHTLLGAPPFAADDGELLLHAQRQGLAPAIARQLERVAPSLAPLLGQALSPTPLLRAGALASLEQACRDLGGDRVSVLGDRGPWVVGSPLMALGAYATATPYGDRFALRPAFAVAATADALPDGVVDRARLDAALRQLDVQRALSQRANVRKERTGLKAAVVVLTAAIAAAIVWFGTRPRPESRTAPGVAPAALRLKRAARPRPVRSIPLFRKGDGPANP